LKNPWIYEAIPIEVLVDTKDLLKIVEVAYRTMLENFVPLNVYFKINLKGGRFYLGQ
jgi:hypothetical protein